MRTTIIIGWVLAVIVASCTQKSTVENQGETENKNNSVELIDNVVPSESDIPMLIGTYTRKEGHVEGKASGVHVVFLNPESGYMRIRGTYEAGINPSYIVVHPQKKYAYVANESGGTEKEAFGSVTALAINEDHSLSILNTRSSEGVAPCHISLNQQGTHVLVANYVTGNVTSYPTALNGKLGSPQNVVQYKGHGPDSRQEAPHAHFIDEISDRLIATVDLGTDTIRFHDFSTGQLQEKDHYFVTKPGAGPRHLVTHPSNSMIYVVNELNATIASYKQNTHGIYQNFQEISTLPEGDSGVGHCAAIKITPDGRYLYASNRGDYNNIAIYKISPDGQLEMISHQSSLGNVPRDIEISPDGGYLIAANQNSDNLVSFRIDRESGLLKQPKVLKNIPTPVCIKFI